MLPKGAAGPGARPTRATWCLATKDQGFGRGEAPRRSRRMPGRAGRRGASRRRFKALAGVKHHVGAAECPAGPRNVVPRDEESSLWPGGGTTSEPPNARSSRATWCPATKVQGFGGGEAPRRSRRMPGRAGRRGASRRRFKALAGGGSTTSNLQNARPASETWCPATKIQGFGGGHHV